MHKECVGNCTDCMGMDPIVSFCQVDSVVLSVRTLDPTELIHHGKYVYTVW